MDYQYVEKGIFQDELWNLFNVLCYCFFKYHFIMKLKDYSKWIQYLFVSLLKKFPWLEVSYSKWMMNF